MSARIAVLAVFAALAFGSGSAVAAGTHKAAKGSTASADNSADQLNATSLSDIKTNTPYTPPAAPAPDAKAKKPAAKKS